MKLKSAAALSCMAGVQAKTRMDRNQVHERAHVDLARMLLRYSLPLAKISYKLFRDHLTIQVPAHCRSVIGSLSSSFTLSSDLSGV